jgi:hypothetical protein
MSSEYYQYRDTETINEPFEQQSDLSEETRLQIRARIMEAVTRHHDEMWHMAHHRREEILKGKQAY